MGITSVGGSATSSAIKAVQTGSAAGAGNVTITSVDVNKSFVQVFGTTSSGSVATTGTVAAMNGNINASNLAATPSLRGYGGNVNNTGGTLAQAQIFNQGNNAGDWWGFVENMNFNSRTYSGNTAAISGGTNNLVAATVQGYLSNSTTLVVSGACRWEVVEFN